MTTKSKPSRLRIKRRTLSFSNKVNPISDSTSYSEQNTTETFSGDDMPNFKAIIANGGNATNAAVGQRVRLESYSPGSMKTTAVSLKGAGTPVSVWVIDTMTTTQLSGYMTPIPTISFAATHPTADNRAKQMFVSRANRELNSFQGGQFIGELKETIQMVRHPLNSLTSGMRDYLNTLKKRRSSLQKSSISRKQKAISGLWLEYSFGWAPLVQDINSAWKALGKFITERDQLIPVTGHGEYDEYLAPAPSSVSCGALTVNYRVHIKDSHRVNYYGKVRIRNSGSAERALQLSGLSLRDFVPTVWELIPYSFLVDYLVNAGDVIEAACFNTSNLAYWGSSAKRSRVWTAGDFQQVTSHPPPNFTTGASGYYDTSWSPGKMVLRAENFSRTVGPSLVPSLEFSIKGTFKRLANVTALLAQHRRLIPF